MTGPELTFLVDREGFQKGRPYPGVVLVDGRDVEVLVWGDDGRAVKLRSDAVRADVAGWRMRHAVSGEIGMTPRKQLATRIREMRRQLHGIRRGGAGDQAFASCRESCVASLRVMAEVIGDDELQRELWE